MNWVEVVLKVIGALALLLLLALACVGMFALWVRGLAATLDNIQLRAQQQVCDNMARELLKVAAHLYYRPEASIAVQTIAHVIHETQSLQGDVVQERFEKALQIKTGMVVSLDALSDDDGRKGVVGKGG